MSRAGMFYFLQSQEDYENRRREIEERRRKRDEWLEDHKTNENCPICGSPMHIREGRYGKFLGCSKYPDCKGIRKINHNGSTRKHNFNNINSSFKSLFQNYRDEKRLIKGKLHDEFEYGLKSIKKIKILNLNEENEKKENDCESDLILQDFELCGGDKEKFAKKKFDYNCLIKENFSIGWWLLFGNNYEITTYRGIGYGSKLNEVFSNYGLSKKIEYSKKNDTAYLISNKFNDNDALKLLDDEGIKYYLDYKANFYDNDFIIRFYFNNSDEICCFGFLPEKNYLILDKTYKRYEMLDKYLKRELKILEIRKVNNLDSDENSLYNKKIIKEINNEISKFKENVQASKYAIELEKHIYNKLYLYIDNILLVYNN